MKVGNILYSSKFIKRLKILPVKIIDLAIEKEAIFKENPLHPSLRLHELKGELSGLWSISLNRSYRIIFTRMDNGDILFVSIGKHDLYGNL
ncbi:type II toxin-antitoxin system mRNA interferase toxin, RelE/StbE family [bacterium]|nr:type II toxin-antitoxin system mRNA interferase toxin, RelE/StbE family [bacterium]